MPMLADVVDAVVGVDTHRDTHQAEIATATGAPIATATFPNSDAGFANAGFAALLAWVLDHIPTRRLVVAIEGTRSYGIGLTRAVLTAGLHVIEVEQPARTTRHGKGKSDSIDAHHAVVFALNLDPARLPSPRTDGDREALRILLNARDAVSTAQTANINMLRALLLAGHDGDRALARASALTVSVLTALTRRRGPRHADTHHRVRLQELRRLACAVLISRRELAANERQLRRIITGLVPGLLEVYGVGPVTAAQVIVAFSHPGRCRSEAAFAALGGTSPLPASSGKTVRHRLNRGGDRALNSALHIIARTRMRSCLQTQAYIARRTTQGKTGPEIRRCLKRYIARQLYRMLTATMTTTAPALTSTAA